MTSRAWWTARWLLFDEKFGPLIREAEHERERAEARLGADYARSVATLRKMEGGPDGVR